MQTVDELRGQLRGPAFTDQDDGYDGARRVYNGMIDRRPRLVVRCVDATDVQAAIRYARDCGLEISVRGGTHSVPGYGTNDGGLVIDLTTMKGVRVDPAARTARAGGGCTWGDFNHASYAYGLATTGGIVSTTGIAGLTLGGGIGYLTRGCGLTIDNLLSADVVTADGRLLTAGDTQNPDLFWALRGGGGNFGVVTSFEYRMHPVKDVLAGLFLFDLEHAEHVLEATDRYLTDAPEELGAFPAFHLAPPLPFIPEERQGKPHCVVVACWTGPLEEGEKAMAPLRNSAPLAAEMVAPMPYYAMNALFDPLLPPGLQHYWKAVFTPELNRDAIAAHLAYGPKVPAVNTAVHIYPINGASHRVAPDATAFAYRNAKYATVIAGMWPDPADNEANIAWVRDYYAALAPVSAPGGYVNFMGADDQDRIRDNYGANYDRLATIKKTYDPDNVFHHNQNIRPAA